MSVQRLKHTLRIAFTMLLLVVQVSSTVAEQPVFLKQLTLSLDATLVQGTPLRFGDYLYFGANDGVNGRQVWRTDGTPEGTELVVRTNPTGTSSPTSMQLFQGKLLFRSTELNAQGYVYLSDGTQSGTHVVLNPDPTKNYGGPSQIEAVGDLFFFRASRDGTGIEPWVSDGTGPGTQLLLDVNPGSNTSGSIGFTKVSGGIVFVAQDDVNGGEAWRTDGTEAGTYRITDLARGGFSAPYGFGDIAVMSGSDGIHGSELWRTDGTAEGTVLVKDILPGDDPVFGRDSHPTDFALYKGIVYFSAASADAGQELWRTDGTEAGTWLVKDIDPRTPSLFQGNGQPNYLTAAGDLLYFSGVDADHGPALWRSDGTDEGTWLVKDTRPGVDTFTPREFHEVQGYLVFNAIDATHGFEPWISDGTEAGTRMIVDLNPTASSDPGFFAAINGVMVFGGSDGEKTALWAVNLPPMAMAMTLEGPLTTGAATVSFTVSFNEPVSGVDPTDFALLLGGSVSGASVTVVTGGPETYTVTVDTGSGDGTLGLRLLDCSGSAGIGQSPISPSDYSQS